MFLNAESERSVTKRENALMQAGHERHTCDNMESSGERPTQENSCLFTKFFVLAEYVLITIQMKRRPTETKTAQVDNIRKMAWNKNKSMISSIFFCAQLCLW